MEIKELAEKIYNRLESQESIIIRSGESIYNLNHERVIEINVQMAKVEKFLNEGIGNEEKEKQFLEDFKDIIEKVN